jgi:tRNA threonylcarbamoyladenosine biosynthesis protein TsaE
MRIETTSPAETAEVGASLATRLRRGDTVLVSGDLGAGKTTLVRGACRALGVEGPVTSPTFTIGQVYAGRGADGAPLEIAHLDLYRLPTLEGEDPALLDDYLTADRIGFVEWPGSELDRAPRVAARVSIAHLGGDRRVLEVA